MIQDANNTDAKVGGRFSDEPTAISPDKPPKQAAPGKKWVKVKKTEQTMDAKGYMCFQDVEVWEEVDDARAAKKSAAVKATPATQIAAEKK